MIARERFRILMLAAGIFLILAGQAVAQGDSPNRPIEVIVPYGPGGPNDMGARYLSGKWAEVLGQAVVVVNKDGAAGGLGARYVANAKPDGYTLLATSDSAVVWSRMGRKDSKYDLDSFRFLFNFGKSVIFFSVKADSRWKTLDDFIKEAKQSPGKLKYASVGPGSVYNMVADMMCEAAGGIKLTDVPFKSSPASLTALAGGNVDMAITMSLSGVGTSGLIRTLAVSGEKRVSDFPNIPTLKELGYPIKYAEAEHGIAAPVKTPEKVVAKFLDAHNKVWAKYLKDIEEKFPGMGAYPLDDDGKTAKAKFKEKEVLVKAFYSRIGFKVE